MRTVNNRKAIILQKGKGFTKFENKVFDNRHLAIKFLEDYEPREELVGKIFYIALLDKTVNFSKTDIKMEVKQ